MTQWCFISCTKSKESRPCSAQSMYWPSRGFRLAWEYAKANGLQVLIFSAKYGALHPYELIAPYDATLIGASLFERERWAATVIQQLTLTYPNDPEATIKAGDTVVSFLPKDYGEILHRVLRENGVTVEEPLKGLSQGRRMQWFKRQLGGAA